MVRCCCCGDEPNEAHQPLVPNEASTISLQPEPGSRPVQHSMGGPLTLPIPAKQRPSTDSPAYSPSFPRRDLLVTQSPEQAIPVASEAAMDFVADGLVSSDVSVGKRRSTSAFGAPKQDEGEAMQDLVQQGDSFESVDGGNADAQKLNDVQTDASPATPLVEAVNVPPGPDAKTLQPEGVAAIEEMKNATSDSESSVSDSDDSSADSEVAFLGAEGQGLKDEDGAEQGASGLGLDDEAAQDASASGSIDGPDVSDPAKASRPRGQSKPAEEEEETELQRRLRRQKERADAKEPDRKESVDDSELRERLRQEQDRKVAKGGQNPMKHFNQQPKADKPNGAKMQLRPAGTSEPASKVGGFDSKLEAKLALQKAKAESGENPADFAHMNEAQRKTIRKMESKLEAKLAQQKAKADLGGAAELGKIDEKRRKTVQKMETKLAAKLDKQKAKEESGTKSWTSTKGPSSPKSQGTGQMDPKLAARLARQKEKELTGESAVMMPKSPEVASGPQIDAQLASRLAKQQENAEVLGQSQPPEGET